MECEFEEKQYEHLINLELAYDGRLFPVGQVLENTLGIDAALFSKNRRFWKIWGNWWNWLFPWKKGLYLDEAYWDILQKTIDNDEFPTFKCNVFIQYKRPEYISSPRGKEYSYWNKPYFRYELRDNQQKILLKLEQKIATNGIVTYACPAFWRSKELWEWKEKNKLIENSNFTQPQKLNGHDRYTFITKGKTGQAFSEPASVENLDLLNEVKKILDRPIEFKNNTDFIYSLYKTIELVVEESDEEFREIYYRMKEYMPFQHKLARSLISIMSFNFINNISWQIGY